MRIGTIGLQKLGRYEAFEPILPGTIRVAKGCGLYTVNIRGWESHWPLKGVRNNIKQDELHMIKGARCVCLGW